MAVINGTASGDTLIGTKDSDSIFGLGGSDNINATQGTDTVDGGTGNDRLTIFMGNVDRFDAHVGPRTYTLSATSVTDSAGLLNTSMTSVERITFSTVGTGDYDDIVNASGFTSSASSAMTITTGNGNDTITGSGIADNIIAGRGNNWVDSGAGADSVRFYFDNSLGGTIVVTGTAGSITASANGVTSTALNTEDLYIMGDDLTTGTTIDASAVTADVRLALINSMYGSDVFIGHNGVDIFGTNYLATSGGDTYTGNGGADIFDYVVSVLAMNGDVITDFDSDDLIDLTFNNASINGGGALADKFIGAAGFSGTAGEYRFQIAGATTQLQVDTNGDGLADQTLTMSNGTFALTETSQGSNQLKLAASNVGTDGDDILNGTSAIETIQGLAGDDVISGDGGDDVIDGGTGSDTASFANAGGSIQAYLYDDGFGEVFGADGHDQLLGIENLTGSAYNDRLSGNSQANVLIGGDGSDTAVYASASGAIRATLKDDGTGGSTGAAGIDSFVSIENVTGSAFNDVITGNALANAIDGSDGDDILKGAAGNDTLTGGAGYDRMYGGLGDDTYIVNDVDDYAYELAGEGRDSVVSSIDHQLRVEVEDLTLTGAAAIGKGNAADNSITGNDVANKLYGYQGDDMLVGNGGDDYLLGGDGNDTMSGGAGYDRMYGSTGDDTYIVGDAADYAYENAGEGYDTVVASLNHQLRANIEQLTLDGTADLRGYGNGLDNMIAGNSGANALYGRDGNDTIHGNLGNDILFGENGDDTLFGGLGLDRSYGGSGADTFAFDDGDFAGMSSGTSDRVHDFSQVDGDRISLELVDANAMVDADQAFTFVGTAAFSGLAGELRYQQIVGNTYVQGDTNGDGVADFWIRVDGLHALATNDFLL